MSRSLLLFSVVLLFCAACGGAQEAPAADANPTNPTATVSAAMPTEAAAAATAPAAAQDAPSATQTDDNGLPLNAAGVAVVAQVNGQDITLPEFERALARRQAGTLVADYNTLVAAELDTMIEQILIVQAAAELGLTISDEQVENEIANQRSLIGSGVLYDPTLYTEEEYREAQREALLTQAVIERVIATQEPLPEARARHIVVDTEEEAQLALSRLQNGEDFEVVARELSNDVTTRDSGGDLGWFIREDLLLTPELANAAFQMQPGQIAGPIPTQIGYHIIQLLELGERQPGDIADDPILAQSRFSNWLQTLLENASIQRFLN